MVITGRTKKIVDKKRSRIIETSLLAGKIMLENGAETSRVEDTMERIITHSLGKAKGENTYTYITVNGIFVKLDAENTSFVRIDTRDHNLDKITRVNQLSRSYVANDISLNEMYAKLQSIQQDTATFPLWFQFLCTALLSGSVMFILGGSLIDFPYAMVAGFVCFLIYLLVRKSIQTPFVPEFTASFIGGMIAYCTAIWFGSNLDYVMIGTIAPLAPGIAITNAIRDIMAKHYISGLVRGLEASAIAVAIGTGIATVYYLFII